MNAVALDDDNERPWGMSRAEWLERQHMAETLEVLANLMAWAIERERERELWTSRQ